MNTMTTLFRIFTVFTFSILATNSCSETKINSKSLVENKLEDNATQNSATVVKPAAFQLPPLQELAMSSPTLEKESFDNGIQEIKFIAGDLLILSFDRKIAYLNLLPKTTEDDIYNINLVIQNLDSNVPTVAKKWTINNESGEVIILADFYENYKNVIKEIFDREGIMFLQKKLSFKIYDQIKDVIIKSKYKKGGNDLQEIKTVEIFSKNHKPIYLQRYSKNTLCVECDSLLLYKGDYLGEISIDEQSKKLLVLGFLEQIDHSPSALHIRLVYLN